jgi:hypothetical protein
VESFGSGKFWEWKVLGVESFGGGKFWEWKVLGVESFGGGKFWGWKVLGVESFGGGGMCRIICMCARGGPAAGSGGGGPVGSGSIRYKQYIRLVQLRFFVLLARFIRYSSGLSQPAEIIF